MTSAGGIAPDAEDSGGDDDDPDVGDDGVDADVPVAEDYGGDDDAPDADAPSFFSIE